MKTLLLFGLGIFISIILFIIIHNNLYNIDTIKDNLNIFLSFTKQYYIFSVLLYIGLYIMLIGCFLPGAQILSFIGGALFGYWGILYATLGASSGSVLAAFIARYLLREKLEKKYTEKVKRFNKEFLAHKNNYLIALHLTPIIPFTLVNSVAGLSRVDLKTIFICTFVGVLPATIIDINIGTQLFKIDNIRDIVSPSILLGLFFLGLLSLVPKFIKTKI
jgi:uncharacterized membrane protein YdjX (TVP38/TMEM64 family)